MGIFVSGSGQCCTQDGAACEANCSGYPNCPYMSSSFETAKISMANPGVLDTFMLKACCHTSAKDPVPHLTATARRDVPAACAWKYHFDCKSGAIRPYRHLKL